MKKISKLKANLFYNICYQILSLIVPLITAPYISRVLGVSGVGEYSYSYSVAHYFVLFIMLGVLNYGNREIASVKDSANKVALKFSEIYVVQLTLGIVVASLYMAYVAFFCKFNRLVALAQILYIISALLDISWVYFGIERFKTTAGVSSLNKIATTVLIFMLVQNKEDVFVYTVIIAGGALLNNILYWIMLKRYINISVISLNVKNIRRHLKPMLVLFIPVIAISVYKYMDKIMLGILVDTSEVGIYESAEKFVNLPLSLITAVGTVMLPRISNLKEKVQNKEIKKYNYISMVLIMFLGFGIVFGLAGVTDRLIPWFYGREFVRSTYVLLILLPSVLFVSWANVVRTQCLLPNKRDKEYCISVILGAIVNLIINILLIQKYGAIGAAIGTTIAELFVCLIQSFQTRKEMEFIKYIIDSIPFAISAFIMFLVICSITFTSDLYTIVVRSVVVGLLYCASSSYFIRKTIKAIR